ncbi:hypothetical protein [Pseudomonas fluorescens]|uniref:hypothetical protein n=1 Tax=Pseudomonas fluorescens TaxID=294 RepID=UPI001241C6CB|nr:hypothetical protein [Pseudomonas fluorescens]
MFSGLSFLGGNPTFAAVAAAFVIGMAVGQAFSIARIVALIVIAASLFGCAEVGAVSNFNAGQNYRASTNVAGVPVSGSVRVGISKGGIILQPGLNVRQIKFSR